MTTASGPAGRSASFTLIGDGLLHRLQRRTGLPSTEYGAMGVGIALTMVAWVPLLVLSSVANNLTNGPAVPFLFSVGTHVRLLVAIPLFFVAEATFGRRVRQVIEAMGQSPLVPARERPRFDRAIDQARRFRDSWTREIALILITVLLIWAGLRLDMPEGVSTWRHTLTGQDTAAGRWYAFVSLPIFQFLIVRWFTVLLIWAYCLWRIRGLDLQLMPSHPDLSGGLGNLGVAQIALAPLNFAMSSIIVATFAEQIEYGGTEIGRVVVPLAGAILLGTFILIAPLLFFAPMLIRTKQRGFVEYGTLAASYTHAFEQKWMRRTPPSEPLLGSADIQSLADLANAFDVVRQMRFVPMARTQIVALLMAGVLPALPLVLFVVPFDQLIIRGARMLLHI